MKVLRVFLASCVVLLASQAIVQAQQDPFYKGKTISAIVPFAPGGGYAIYTQIMARHLPKHIPGQPTIVPQYMPGAGGIVASNHVYNLAKRDGTVMATVSDSVALASVIDADTIEIHGQRIRLHGIDAPEGRQTCELDGQPYRCGQQAALALADYIGQRTVVCEQRDVDRYQRVVAVCHVGGEDMGAWLVSEGWALAYRRYSTDYVDEEDGARTSRRGLWRGEFIPPWEWRQNH